MSTLEKRTVAIAGNPNVGKSTVFNALTGMHQHTGNWPGKTVACARGTYTYNSKDYELIDTPGSYSLAARSLEEEITREFICFGGQHATVVVCSAVCLERNLNLVLQVLEITPHVVVCVNLMDEARKKSIFVDIPTLSDKLGVPVIAATARSREGLCDLMGAIEHVCDEKLLATEKHKPSALNQIHHCDIHRVAYPLEIERAAAWLEPELARLQDIVPARWLALQLIEGNGTLPPDIAAHMPCDITANAAVMRRLRECAFAADAAFRPSHGTSAPSTSGSLATESATAAKSVTSSNADTCEITAMRADGYSVLLQDSDKAANPAAPYTMEQRHSPTDSKSESILSSDFFTARTAASAADSITAALCGSSRRICAACVTGATRGYGAAERALDRILTGRFTRFPLMAVLLALVLWITVAGANYPSDMLSCGFSWLEAQLYDLLVWLGASQWLCEMIACGVFRTLGWVVSVMLPPMAIFFPLFTLLEDSGYLPRVAFNMDHSLKRCGACGKQALTMCMGFGCNAVGVTGCRIIDSPRERMLAILTNSFVPCNGRFPTLVAVISMFLVAGSAITASIGSALILTGVIMLGIAATLLCSRLLSATVLRGIPTAYTLELPPYRKPLIGQVIVRSMLDRTLFVLGRAIAVAAPAGLVLWIMANAHIGDATLLAHCTRALDPIGAALGMDGVILTAFILGFPANETVLPIMIMAYTAQGSMVDVGDISTLYTLLAANGWTWTTALCVIIFTLLHWPCSTTCITIYKETRSLLWTALAFLLPTIAGAALCAIVSLCLGAL